MYILSRYGKIPEPGEDRNARVVIFHLSVLATAPSTYLQDFNLRHRGHRGRRLPTAEMAGRPRFPRPPDELLVSQCPDGVYPDGALRAATKNLSRMLVRVRSSRLARAGTRYHADAQTPASISFLFRTFLRTSTSRVLLTSATPSIAGLATRCLGE